MRILIVAEHASASFGGEAALPLHYYRVLRKREQEVWLLTHARVRDELKTLYPNDVGTRIVFVEDTWLHKSLWRLGSVLPARLAYLTTGYLSRLSTQWVQRKQARTLVRTHGIDLVHQPMPVSPKEPSLLYDIGAPVVIGPMNGGMSYPPAFRASEGRLEAFVVGLGRSMADALNRLIPGKRHAACLIVANERTALALPSGSRRVETLVENGVDLSLWKPRPPTSHLESPKPVNFVFMGRLVDWKAVDLLIEAFDRARRSVRISLLIIGDGPEGALWRALSSRLGILGVDAGDEGKIFFAGWLSQPEAANSLAQQDVLVLSSLLECGGAVVLEAMALGLPVIATDWGGPADYVDPTCGILVSPSGRAEFVDALASAMCSFATDPVRRANMGNSGKLKVARMFDWERKVDLLLEIFERALSESQRARTP